MGSNAGEPAGIICRGPGAPCQSAGIEHVAALEFRRPA